MTTDATYTLIANEKNGDLIIFMGNGKEVITKDFSILASEIGNVVLKQQNGQLILHNEVAVTITHKGVEKKFEAGDLRTIHI